jgi:hypothetical protein
MTEDIVNVLKVAFEQHRAGNVQGAELGYRRVITKDAHQPDALHLLGVLSKNQDDVQGTCDFLTRVHHDALAWTECVTAAGGSLRLDPANTGRLRRCGATSGQRSGPMVTSPNISSICCRTEFFQLLSARTITQNCLRNDVATPPGRCSTHGLFSPRRPGYRRINRPS